MYFDYCDEGFFILLPRNQRNEAVYRVNKRDKDAKSKQRERDTRCRINGKICTGVCSFCERNYERKNHGPLSLGGFIGTKNEPVDKVDMSLAVEEKLLLINLYQTLSDEMWILARELFLKGKSLRTYAKELAKNKPEISEKALYQRLYRKLPALKKEIENFLKDWQ